jgi:CRISPR system Cascade subunit CasB
MSKESDRWVGPFIDKLLALAPPDAPERWARGTLAELRRGLGKDVSYILARTGRLFNGVPEHPPNALDDAGLIASLFASYPKGGGEGNLGAAFRTLRERTGSDSVEKRFVALVDSSKEGLPGRLRQAVLLLKAKDVTLSWTDLLHHVRNWDRPSRWVQGKWTREFWQEGRPEQPQADAVTVIVSTNE